VNKSGYLYIWVSNETQGWDVFFDNLSVQYKQGPVLEENHYYPFGLTMAGISDKAVKTQYAENKYRFNSGNELQNKEFSDGSGLEEYDANFRMYDPQLGRFWQIDPLTDINEDQSPYSFAGNNPVLMNDPLGLLSDSAHPQELATVTVVGHKAHCVTCSPSSISAGPPPSKGSAVAGGPSPSTETVSNPIREEMENELGHNPIYNLDHDVVEEATSWDRFVYGVMYKGKNAFGEKVFQKYYGGTAPAEGPGGSLESILGEVEDGANFVERSTSVLKHIFRNAPGHLNISSILAQARYIKLFEKIANNATNLNQSILTAEAIANGVKGYTKIFRNGTQLWVMVRNGRIFNAGINLIPK